VARNQSAVSGTSRSSPFIWAESLPDFARTQSRIFLISLTPDTYTGVLLRRSPGGMALSTCVLGLVVPAGVPLIGPDT
jgi:hypothetical protein